jgi:hypothetical protein
MRMGNSRAGHPPLQERTQNQLLLLLLPTAARLCLGFMGCTGSVPLQASCQLP